MTEADRIKRVLAGDVKYYTDGVVDAVLDFLDGRHERFRITDVRRAIEPKLGDKMPTDRALAVELQRLDCESLGKVSVQGRKIRLWEPPAVPGTG